MDNMEQNQKFNLYDNRRHHTRAIKPDFKAEIMQYFDD